MVDLISSDNKENWNNYLNMLGDTYKDIYFSCEYQKLYEKNGDGKARLFVYKDGINIGMYPFLINEIDYDANEKYYDIQSAYGYGGPIINNKDEEFLNKFENAFLQFCNQSNIIAEFIRFHPLIKNEGIFKRNIIKLHNRNTVYLDLNKGIKRIWDEDIKSKNRNMIRKAKKNGLVVEESKNYKSFKEIYLKTMINVGAKEYYYFDDYYYDSMSKSENCILLNVKMDEEIVASALFLFYGDYFHYHLSGSVKEYCKLGPNNLLIWEAIKLACSKEKKAFHLGGGLTDSLDDSLFKFKSSFSKNIADFYIGKRIHNKKVYEKLISEWEKKNNRKSNLFLQYRY